jgi:hypothetical protein
MVDIALSEAKDFLDIHSNLSALWIHITDFFCHQVEIAFFCFTLEQPEIISAWNSDKRNDE